MKEDEERMDNRMAGKGVGFERIRRITGYLVGTVCRWNNAKRAEERDRVKHMDISSEPITGRLLEGGNKIEH